jgi:RsiW-degrading membrane proteinase PrsW (M82 family)
MDIGSFFGNPSAWGIGLALIFGTVWLASLVPLRRRSPWLWLIFVAGAILFAPSIAWIQAPLQNLTASWFINQFGLETYQSQILLMAIPVVLLSGLVQEGAKLIPVVVYWWRKGRAIDPNLGLSIGAMAGAGYGIFEAQWLLNMTFAAGWSWNSAQLLGTMSALAPFWERFFTIAFHTASTALAGWGLAKGWGWQFYLLASFLHFALNYSTLFSHKAIITASQIETIIAVFAAIVFGVVLWLRWRKSWN